MAESILRDKSKEFANQLRRSGTSIGANIHEHNKSKSKQKINSKMWIRL